jgi:hypothetical protein
MVSVGIAFLTACSSNWQVEVIEPQNIELPFFLDEDDDGWGALGSDYELREIGDEGTNFTARNNRDCDDANVAVTGLVGSICPDRLVVGATEYSAITYGDEEFVAVHDASDLVWPEYAVDACSPWGWGGAGGGLAKFADATELAQVQDLLADYPVYAGWVGVTPDGSGGWSWEDGTAIGGFLPLCDDTPASDEIDPARARLALMKLDDTAWCLGTPDQVLVQGSWPNEYTPPDYSAGYGYFVCERPVPDPAPFAVDPPEADTASE